MAKHTKKIKRDGFKEELAFKRPEPPVWRFGRHIALQMAKINRDLWTDLEEAESGNYIISGLTTKVSSLDFEAFSFALAQALYNQSFMCNNDDVNSGISRKIALKTTEDFGEEVYIGDIIVTRGELYRLGWGAEPTAEDKKKIENLIDTFHNTSVDITNPNNGETTQSWLCTKSDKGPRKGDGAITYRLHLHPLFGMHITSQYGELPQDITTDLSKACKRMEAAHFLLLRWLCVQDKRESHPLNIETLITKLKMEEYFKENRGKAEKRLLSICNTMVEIGVLSKYETERKLIRKKERIVSITFYLNPKFPRHHKDTKAALDEIDNGKDK